MTLLASQSVVSRFSFSLMTNLLKAGVGLATGLIVARGLGPEQYGRMMFLLGTFLAVRGLLEVGSSTAFFTFLSQRQRSSRFVGWFSGWLAVQFFLPLLLIGVFFPVAWIDLIWKGEQRSLVLMAFIVVFLQSVMWAVIMQMGESQRLTKLVQGTALSATSLHFILMAIAWTQGWLEIRLIYGVMILEWSLAICVVATQLRFPKSQDGEDRLIEVLKEFGRYCLPLIPYQWLGFVHEFADKWLLQSYGGSVQQAYYSVAYQFGAIAGIAASSFLNVFWKEIAEANHEGKNERVASLYRRVSRGLFFVSATVAGFLVPWVEEIIILTLGPAYVGGSVVLAVMFLYPMHQSMGMIGGTMLYATGRIRAQVILGMAFMISSLVVCYIVLVPSTSVIPGFGLEAIGLAGKMVAMQFIGVNVTAIYLARSLNIKFDWVYQPVSGLGCIGAGWFASELTRWYFEDTSANFVQQMMLSGLLYLPMLLAFVWLVPSLVGITRHDFITYASRIYPKVRNGQR